MFLSRMSAWLCLLFFANLLPSILADPPSTLYQLTGDTGLTYTIAVNVPSNQTDDLYFHLTAPFGNTWIAFGFGTGMAGALIFVVYPSADGNNVTISPRLGTGHVMPTYTSDVKVNVLEGSGFVNGYYIVNAQCTGCRSWSGGNSIDVTSSAQPMLWAIGSEAPIETDSLTAVIHQHSNYGTFTSNLLSATGEGGVPITSDNSTSGNTGNYGDDSMDPTVSRAIHGVLMVGAFLIVFPSGFLFLRVFERVWLHAVVQTLGALGVILGAGAGISLSIKQQISPKLNAPHQIIGLVVLGLVIMTWFAGLFGHRMYKKTGTPAPPMKVHRTIGPLSVAIGLINCVVGFHFASNNSAMIGFIIFTTLMIILVTLIQYFVRRRKMRRQAMTTPAAQNFRQAQMEPQSGGIVRTSDAEEAIPMHPYRRPQSQTLPSYHSDGGDDQTSAPRYQ